MALASTAYVQPFVYALVLHPQTVYHRNACGVYFSKFLRICDTELLSPMGNDKNDLILMANRQTGDIRAYGIIKVYTSQVYRLSKLARRQPCVY